MSRRYDYAVQVARQQAAAARWQAAEIRRQEAEARRAERQARQDYLAEMQGEAEDRNSELDARVDQLTTVLSTGLGRVWQLDFESLKRPTTLPEFDAQGRDRPAPAPARETFMPKPEGFFAKLLPGASAKRATKVAAAEQAFQSATEEHAAAEKRRVDWLAEAKRVHDVASARLRAEIEAQHADVDQFRASYLVAEPSAVVHYFEAVLRADPLPEGFPAALRVAFVPESKQLVIERQLPDFDCVPKENTFRYVRSKNSIEAIARPQSQVRALYAGLVAQMALRTLHAAVSADSCKTITSVALNCFVDTVDPATGKPVQPCLVSVRTTSDAFAQIDLRRVDPAACLKGLNAQVSRSPHELAPVRPIVDFNMVDPRFIQSGDVLSTLDQRANLADLKPQEFEALITNLFGKMGLETKLTQASRDGGVDCVAWDMRPVVGGKVIVQAKRYKHTVGVSAVRDLFGTVLNEGAAKGILVTTSGYGKASVEFAANKPLELIAGGQLLYLLEEHTGIQAKIEFPQDWVDPVLDTEEVVSAPQVAAALRPTSTMAPADSSTAPADP